MKRDNGFYQKQAMRSVKISACHTFILMLAAFYRTCGGKNIGRVTSRRIHLLGDFA